MKHGVMQDVSFYLQENKQPFDLSEVGKIEASIKDTKCNLIQKLQVEKGVEEGYIIVKKWDNTQVPLGSYYWDMDFYFTDGRILTIPETTNATWTILSDVTHPDD